MAGHSAARRENARRGLHALDVVGTGLDARQHDGFAARGGFFRGRRGEHQVSAGGAGAGRQAVRDAPSAARGGFGLARFEHRLEQLIQRLRGNSAQGLALVDHAFAHEIDGDAHGREAGALAGAALQNVELAALDRELEILHVAVVAFEHRLDAQQFAPSGRRMRG